MASRRPPSSRSKPALQPPTTSRQQRATTNPLSPTLSEHPETQPTSLPPSRPNRSQHDDGETNIQVVIRCRRRSEREIQENSPIIVSSNGPKSNEITIETSTPVSSLGVVTLPPTRTYPFDLVFGPEADQAMIYHEVVSPLLDEVIMGYNCTLFAYGQTGTGKTYTMQGDLTPTPMGNPSAQAGMIPRVLFRLFHRLETSVVDYSVKISFVELYNEELRDLLANEMLPPLDRHNPWGKAKGVFIQGLEDIPVKDARDALALLTKGSHRRQIAATKFNDHSSRSHSVFSITVHTKETSNIGDDLLKVGKLNLVDLAGSENIARSGAENKRAREAGMINQSLLTLGRVINALVDRSPHVPYRESKLTRLLQDSLGGRTKTCIIATISPARSNMEETLSTLDYAIRAKSIRNKPELNQRMTRNSLLKEYVAEIERLKADVLAAREKNGIFFSEERWNQMTVEQEQRQTEMEEAKKQVDILESQLRSVREEFEQSLALLMRRNGELKETKEKLKETEGELEQKEGQLKQVKGALEEEMVVRQAYQVNESKLDGVACGLKQVATESIEDVGALFDKLQRKSKTFTSNIKVVSHQGKSISAEVQALSDKLEEFIKVAAHSTQSLRAEAKTYHTRELETLASYSERIDQQSQRIQDSLRLINAKDDASAEALGILRNAVKDSQETLKSSFAAWSDALRTSSQALSAELYAANQSNFAAVENALKAMGSVMDTVLTEALAFVKVEAESALQAKSLVDEMSRAEIAHLQTQNARLLETLEAEKVKSEKAKDELLQRVSTLLGEFVATRDLELRQAFDTVTKGNAKVQETITKLGQKHERLMSDTAARGVELSTSFQRRTVECKRTRDGALKSVGSAQASFKDGLSAMQASLATYDNILFSGLDRHNRAKRARVESMNTMVTDVQSELRHFQRGIASTSRNVDGFVTRVVSEGVNLSNSAELYHKAVSGELNSLQDMTRSLVDQGTREDVPTGMTPRKRVWEYVDKWELTKNRDALLQSWRQGHSTATRIQPQCPETFSLTNVVEEPAEADGASGKRTSACNVTCRSSPNATADENGGGEVGLTGIGSIGGSTN
ncbi:P-loop containing nucleoside triphosphate hydrolase protein [Pisolithus thermaeus]|nr:P-loop containing nucleoside triphosphate hydrolase protein [Pisolithus thermaeus]